MTQWRRLVVFAAVVLAAWTAVPRGQSGAPRGEWPTYGGDLGHTRYAALNQITAANFNDLEVAWRFKTDNLGPRPEFNLQSTPLVIRGACIRPAARVERSSRSMPQTANCCGCTAKTKGPAVQRRRDSCRAAAWPTGATARRNASST